MSNQKTYTADEVLKACLSYFKGDELAASTWMSKYAVKDDNDDFLELSPDAMHKRLAREFDRIEVKYSASSKKVSVNNLSDYGQRRETLTFDRIYSFFRNFRYIIPQGSIMSGLGNTYKLASLSNCVVIPSPYDSYGGIFRTDQQLAQLYKRRCGVGVDISTLRPAFAKVSNAAGTTSGAVSFMERFSNTTREVAQHGRRGALMLTMDIAHPDIEDFVKIKQDLTKVTGANVSVRLSDEFMNAVIQDKSYTHRWPIDAENPSITKTIRAKELWDTIIECAHNTAEPGLIFWDRQHLYSTSSVYPGYKNVSTNPCSEIAMQGGDSCRLIALNLYSFIDHPFTTEAVFNYDKFYEVTYESQRLMDDLVDLELEAIDKILNKINHDPEPADVKQEEINIWELLKETGRKSRRTGLGFTALADMLAAMNLKYDSDESLEMIEKLMRTKCQAEFDSSIDLAIERGRFEDFDPKIEATSAFVQMLEEEFPALWERMMQYGRRNISLSTVAPTGSLSILAQTSSGIEPVFMLKYKRRTRANTDDNDEQVDFIDSMGDKWKEYDVYHPKLQEWLSMHPGSSMEDSPYFESTAGKISWQKRIEIQSVIQKYVTHSISSTINLPEDVSREEVGNIYLESWKKYLKGITVYREGSRSGVLIDSSKKQEWDTLLDTVPPKRPDALEADVIRFRNNEEKWIAVIGLLNGRPYEIFTGRADTTFKLPEGIDKGKVVKILTSNGKKQYDFIYTDDTGKDHCVPGLSASFDKEFWNYAKLISGVLRHGMPLPYVVDLVLHLDLKEDNINTWKNGVVRALSRYIKSGTVAIDRICPVCNDPEGLVYEEGCLKCKSCGHTECG